MISPVAVLRSIAKEFGCGYGEIEASVVKAMGGPQMEIIPEPYDRLRAIRVRLLTPEAECVIHQAHMIAREMAASVAVTHASMQFYARAFGDVAKT